ncbi:MAG: 7-cyano-7-deazaguanine synthase QueC [Nitrospirae bacterium]|nr:7-cyano-7-deazaguanine synthase QueC [Nitrospirota bacterium]
MNKIKNKRAVVLLSGGLDSATTATIAKAEGYEVHALSFDYAQRHLLELQSAKMVAESLGIDKHLFMKFDLREIGGSALTSDIEVPKDREKKTEQGPQKVERLFGTQDIPVTYVPARNTIFLSFALSWAEVLEAPHIFIGANAIDYSGYPDCRPEYFAAFESMANLSTKISVEGKMQFKIRTPLINLTKAEIIKKGSALGLDYAKTWSCYDPQEVQKTDKESPSSGHFVPCGRCDSCLLRAKGFREAGLTDPLDHRLFQK